MFCPNCKDEFREGFDYCKKCDEELVEKLPQDDWNNERKEVEKDNNFFKLDIENVLKIGGLSLMVISVIYTIINTLKDFLPNYLIHPNGREVLFVILSLAYSILYNAMWGLFYYSLGEIIGLLKRRFNDDRS